jgi:hypothetical protein
MARNEIYIYPDINDKSKYIKIKASGVLIYTPEGLLDLPMECFILLKNFYLQEDLLNTDHRYTARELNIDELLNILGA